MSIVGPLAACAGQTQPIASKFVKTASIGPSGGTITVAASDDAEIAGTSIVIPPHALASTTTISIGVSAVPVAAKAPSGSLSAGPSVDFEPSGTTFAVPVVVTLPVTMPSGAATSRVFVEAVEEDGSAQSIPATMASGMATFSIHGFTTYGAMTGNVCRTDADCPRAQVCVADACVDNPSQEAGPPPDGGPDADDAGEDVDATPDDAPGPVLYCRLDSDCPRGETCIANVCGVNQSQEAGPPPPPTDSGPVPDDAGGDADADATPDDAPAPVLNCRLSSDCPSGQACVNFICQ
jgi:Cys-rich repeat protein